MRIPAIVTAGDGRAARSVYGESKVYLELAGRPLVAHVVEVLQRVPEISEIWVVGNAPRLEDIFADGELRKRLHKPVHIVPQRRNLLENCWEAYRRALPGAGPDGRDPAESDVDQAVFYISGDVPLATPQEISEFLRLSAEEDCDYACGLVPESALIPFRSQHKGELGIQVATFNIRDARLRQSNLHYAKPARLVNRHYIEDMYEHRHQREFRDMISLAWRLLREERGGPTCVFYYLIVHLAGLADRWGLRWLSDRLRRIVTIDRATFHLSRLLRADFRFVTTDGGGCAIDVDKESEYDAMKSRFDDWREQQRLRVEELYGPPALVAESPPDSDETSS